MAAPSYGLLPSMASGGVVVEALAWLAEQEVRCSIPDLTATISDIGSSDLLIPSRNMAEMVLGHFWPLYLFVLGRSAPGPFALWALKRCKLTNN